TRDRVHLTGRKHRLPHWEADVLDRHFGGFDIVCMHKDWPLRIGQIHRRRAERLAFQIRGSIDAAALAANNRKWRPVVEHEYSLAGRVRFRVTDLDKLIDVGEPHIITSGPYPPLSP